MEHVIFWGAGRKLDSFFKAKGKTLPFSEMDVLAVCDSDKEKQNKTIGNFLISSPQSILKYNYDFIIISTDRVDDIKHCLERNYGIVEDVLSLDEYVIKKTISFQYEKNLVHNQSRHLNSDDIFDTNSLVVYTGIYGDYDDLKEPQHIIDGAKYICFTDNRNLKSNVWDIRYMPSSKESKCAVREVKLLPHKFLQEYDTSIWVDASFTIVGDLTEYIYQYQRTEPILFFPHYERICIYEEAAACIYIGKGTTEETIRQINLYYNEHYPINNGLVCGGCLVRKHNNKNVIRVMNEWWTEVNTYSKRDQLSLMYVMWKNSFHYDLCDDYCIDNRWIKNGEHNFV